MGKIFKRFMKIFAIIFLLLLIVALFFVFDLFKDEQLPVIKEQEDQNILNILLVGYDQGAEGIPRPDTVLLASVDIKEKAIGILSVPRDTRVEVPGYNNKYKLNSSYVLGGIELFQQVVENLIGVPINCYVQIDFQGFQALVDTLEGIEMDVPVHMYYVDEAGGLYIDIPAGRQILDGKNALNFVRYREPIMADIGRIARQQQFIKAVIDKILNVKVLTKIPSLLGDVRNYFDTNLSFKDIARLAKMAGEFQRDKIEMATLPGIPEYISGVSFWLPQEERLARTALSLLYTKDFIENAKYSVSLLNGSGQQGLAAEKRQVLEDWGFKITGIGNADNFDHEFTTIFYGEEGIEGAIRVSSILGGVPEKDDDIDGPKLKIILGKDQRPEEEGESD